MGNIWFEIVKKIAKNILICFLLCSDIDLYLNYTILFGILQMQRILKKYKVNK